MYLRRPRRWLCGFVCAYDKPIQLTSEYIVIPCICKYFGKNKSEVSMRKSQNERETRMHTGKRAPAFFLAFGRVSRYRYGRGSHFPSTEDWSLQRLLCCHCISKRLGCRRSEGLSSFELRYYRRLLMACVNWRRRCRERSCECACVESIKSAVSHQAGNYQILERRCALES